MKEYVLCLLGLILLVETSRAQLWINEVCSSNQEVILDEYGESSDWIELYNSGNSSINLEGYFLSDDADNLKKWSFSSVILAAGQELLVFASGLDETNIYPHTNFKLSSSGESLSLSDSEGQLIDQVFFPALLEDHSFGLNPDGSDQWSVFSIPSPGLSNNNNPIVEFAEKPKWNGEKQFFNQSTTIELTCTDPDCIIYFSRDGRIPNTESELYQSPIVLDTTTVIRAISISPMKAPSAVLTRTFFIEEEHQLPIVALTCEPEHFWSWEEGLLAMGPGAEEEWPYWGANFWQDWEFPTVLEYFEADQTLGINQQMDIKIHGGRGARTKPMKPFRLLAKDKYGSNTIDYPFFEERERTEFKRLVLRNASGDFNYGHMRDPFLQHYFMRENLNVDALAAKPVVVYLNGTYYGVMYLREKIDEFYLKYNFGIDPNKVDLLEEDSLIVIGDFEAFEEMEDYIKNHDLSLEANYQEALKLVDVENLADVFIVMTNLNNSDWLHNNFKYWRAREEGAKWRFFVFDLDAAMYRFPWTKWTYDTFGNKMVTYQDTNRHVNILKAFLENETYKNYFINRYADLLNTTFRPENFSREVDQRVEEITFDMRRHFGEWPWPGFEIWQEERIPIFYDYLETRPSFSREYVRRYFDLNNEVKLQLSTFPEGAGKIHINSISPESLPWDGLYFNGAPVTLRIEPNPGFEFSHWQSTKTVKEKDASEVIQYNFEEDDEIIAYFSTAGPLLEVTVIGDAIGGTLPITFRLSELMNLKFSIFDLQGRLLSRSAPKEFHGGQHFESILLPVLSSGMYLLQAESESAVVLTKFVIP